MKLDLYLDKTKLEVLVKVKSRNLEASISHQGPDYKRSKTLFCLCSFIGVVCIVSDKTK